MEAILCCRTGCCQGGLNLLDVVETIAELGISHFKYIYKNLILQMILKILHFLLQFCFRSQHFILYIFCRKRWEFTILTRHRVNRTMDRQCIIIWWKKITVRNRQHSKVMVVFIFKVSVRNKSTSTHSRCTEVNNISFEEPVFIFSSCPVSKILVGKLLKAGLRQLWLWRASCSYGARRA